MKEQTNMEATNHDLHKLERWLIYEVADDKSNLEICQERAQQVLSDLLNEAFQRGREFEKK